MRIYIYSPKWMQKPSFQIGQIAASHLIWSAASSSPGGRRSALPKNGSTAREKPADRGWSTSDNLDRRTRLDLMLYTFRRKRIIFFSRFIRTRLSSYERPARLKHAIKMLNAVFKEVGLIVIVRMDTAAMENHARILTNVKKVNYLAPNKYWIKSSCVTYASFWNQTLILEHHLE